MYQNTITAYKLFRTLKSRPGELFPLFIGKTQPIARNVWIDAKFIPTKGFAPRPGWHSGILPVAPHLRTKENRIHPDRIWGKVLVPNDVDWQSIADTFPTRDIRDRVPTGGYYRFPTSKIQGGAWIIGGALKVVELLTDDMVSDILSNAGIDPTPEIHG